MQLTLPTHCQAERIFERLRATSFGVVFHYLNTNTILRCLDIEQKRVWVSLKAEKKNLIQAEILINPGVKMPLIRARLEQILGTNQPSPIARKALLQDRNLTPLIKSLPPHTIIQGDTIYETLFIAILGQQISVSAALSQRRKVMAELGPSIEFEGQRVAALPEPAVLINCDDERFRRLGISRQKARYLRESADWYLTGRLQPAEFENLDDASALKKIQAIPGVGRWTAQIVLMRSLNRPDVFPAADIGLQNMAQKIYASKTRPDEQTLMKLSKAWRGWRSYAALYLWLAC